MDAFLRIAIEEAEKGRREGGIPIGSVVVHGKKSSAAVITTACRGAA